MVALPDTVTMEVARDAQRLLAQALQQEMALPGGNTGVTVDASALRQFDSAALAVLLECQRLAQAGGKTFEVRNPPRKLSELARLYGVEALLMPTATTVG